MNDWTPYQTDHLFLLIGANPLPNYVAALLLAKDRGTVYLLHSGGAHGTGDVADRLKHAIQAKKQGVTIIPSELDEAKSHRIIRKMKELVGTLPSHAAVGLNYTGGTKAMAIHAYRAIENAFPSGVFSYLDARTLSMIIEGGGKPTKSIPVGQDCTVDLAELVSLHGYSKPAIRRTPFQPVFCRGLVEALAKRGAVKEWQKWCRESNCQSLPDVSQYPLLQKARQAFDTLCGGPATPELVAQRLGRESLVQCTKWLIAEWLEEYVLWAITQITDVCNIGNNYSVDLELKKAKGHEFQLDVAAIRGYQLFAVSCMASERKEKCKEHLLEAYVRARQIGGDEARVGLVCCYDDPLGLQQEVEETWFTEGRVRVFGVRGLLDLSDRLQTWFVTTNDLQRA